MELVSISPKKTINKEIDKIVLPGHLGDFTVLQNHAPLVSILRKGKIQYSKDGNTEEFEVEGGVAEIQQNKITVLSEQ